MGHYKDIASMQSVSLAHRRDPRSSHIAAKSILKSGKLKGELKQVHEALTRFPMHTARELSKASGLDYIMISKRLSVLKKMGLANQCRPRVCTASDTGLAACPWEAI